MKWRIQRYAQPDPTGERLIALLLRIAKENGSDTAFGRETDIDRAHFILRAFAPTNFAVGRVVKHAARLDLRAIRDWHRLHVIVKALPVEVPIIDLDEPHFGAVGQR